MTAYVYQKDSAWYLLQTKPRQEHRALHHLQNQGFDCFLPTLHIQKLIRGKFTTVIEPLFSRYLFVRLSEASGNRFSIRSTRGVSKLVTFGGRFATLPDICIDAMQACQGASQRLFEAGDRVVITNGPFAGLEGVYQLPDGDARALVLIDVMNQPQSLKLAVDVLSKAA